MFNFLNKKNNKELKDFEYKFLAETKNYIDKSVDIIEKSYKNNSSDIKTKKTKGTEISVDIGAVLISDL